MNKYLSNYPDKNINFTIVVIGLFLLVTVYFVFLIVGFKRPWQKLIPPYAIIIILLILIMVISNYYNVLHENFKNYGNITYSKIEPFKSQCENISYLQQEKLNGNLHLSKTPLANIFNIDKMCSDHDPPLDKEIGWKCEAHQKQKGQYKLNTAADNVLSSIRYPLKYDGIFQI